MRFLLHCIGAFIDFFSPPAIYLWWEILIGFIEVASIVVVFLLVAFLLAWYYAIAITIVYIMVALAIAAIVEKICKKKQK